MRKEDLISSLEELENSLKGLQSQIGKAAIKYVNRKEIQELAQKTSRKWFEDVAPFLERFGVPGKTMEDYDALFTNLLSICRGGAPSSTYMGLLKQILDGMESDILIPVFKSPSQATAASRVISDIVNITAEENEYLNEALGCAVSGFLRASVVLAWSAAANRMHRVVEKLGFEEFNRKSEELRNNSEGRFKRFKKSFSVHSLSELRATVFDNDLLWVLEFWGLIDANQHERLSICLTMRNNSAHPGEAPISEENLVSFFSDLRKMVFDNPKFKI